MAAAVTLLVNVNFSNLNGGGRVLNFRTGEPVGDAELTGDCSRPRLIHGSRQLKSLRTRSAADGRYSFSFRETWHCYDFFVRATKPGYAWLWDTDIRLAPPVKTEPLQRVLWMVKDEDVVPYRLQSILNQTGGEIIYGDGSGRRAYVQEFGSTAAALSRAHSIATTDEQRAWVEEKFCPLMARHYAAIPERDRALLAGKAFRNSVATWQAVCGNVPGLQQSGPAP